MSQDPLLVSSQQKLLAALRLLFASIQDFQEFDPKRDYTPKEREPFDALSDRYLRAFESCLKFFKTWERVNEASVSDTFRDLLLRMEKQGFISKAQTWVELRDLRNRIAHEYLPEELARIYREIVVGAGNEFSLLKQKVEHN